MTIKTESAIAFFENKTAKALRAPKINPDHIRNRYKVVDSYSRKNGKVKAHYTGMGPNKKVPDMPQKRLKEWLTKHGATEGQVNAIYRVTLDEEGLKTHDLINRGLLDVDNYLQSLNK